jgi:hypothetical protein
VRTPRQGTLRHAPGSLGTPSMRPQSTLQPVARYALERYRPQHGLRELPQTCRAAVAEARTGAQLCPRPGNPAPREKRGHRARPRRGPHAPRIAEAGHKPVQTATHPGATTPQTTPPPHHPQPPQRHNPDPETTTKSPKRANSRKRAQHPTVNIGLVATVRKIPASSVFLTLRDFRAHERGHSCGHGTRHTILCRPILRRGYAQPRAHI